MVAADGEEAAQWLESHDVDLVISDLVMPRLGGRQLYQQLKQAGRPVKFLFTSGYQPHEVAATAAPDPQVPLLPKPWELRDLLTRVREVLDG
jgi:CheY-like chemotaxis protein